ncbi:Alpha-D-kanosaminyltransferase [compost metagenome]|uniref:glycosyltransferase family 4 protein n=1 Tax=Variovorax boronicumulans TaxID=436515 RepID=UPI000BB3D9EA|nr:glycosyltransferase family 4 protein [Variovorax boronicumulans]PBI85503.1 Alpha-D-kanosaminyltransferase [Variovorax boronicumulans]
MKLQAKDLPEIWFWQIIISPHMAELAVELARQGCKVIFVASQAMSTERSTQGWLVPDLSGVALKWIDHDDAVLRLVEGAGSHSVHLCQGIRANGRVSIAQKALARRKLEQWVVMETVEDSGLRGLFKRIAYSRVFRNHRKLAGGVLAIGHRTAAWVIARGMPANRVFPFAYFLSDASAHKDVEVISAGFRFIFVGQLIPRKRVDLLIDALAELKNKNFEAWFVGAGVEESVLKELADKKLNGRARWLGPLSITDVPSVIAQADCLVLPSFHDGWGAVCSEALMIGTPVICSDACGAAGVVRASGVGGVFPRDDPKILTQLLAQNLDAGIVGREKRSAIAYWGQALGAKSGAAYLIEILRGNAPPAPPWQRGVIEHTRGTATL